ncbi:MAG: hypothetical protein COA80_19850, partial [Leeuwenhoekiella sp.]
KIQFIINGKYLWMGVVWIWSLPYLDAVCSCLRSERSVFGSRVVRFVSGVARYKDSQQQENCWFHEIYFWLVELKITKIKTCKPDS